MQPDSNLRVPQPCVILDFVLCLADISQSKFRIFLATTASNGLSMIVLVRGVEMLEAHGKLKIRDHAGKESHREIIGGPDDARWWRMGSVFEGAGMALASNCMTRLCRRGQC
jgi:hypothetical protein